MEGQDKTVNPREVAEALTAADLLKAEEVWIKTIQLLSFPDEIKSLKKGTVTMKQLNLFQDEKDIIRCQGRINNAAVAASNQYYYPHIIVLQNYSSVRNILRFSTMAFEIR